jgi:hypothetical protein
LLKMVWNFSEIKRYVFQKLINFSFFRHNFRFRRVCSIEITPIDSSRRVCSIKNTPIDSSSLCIFHVIFSNVSKKYRSQKCEPKLKTRYCRTLYCTFSFVTVLNVFHGLWRRCNMMCRTILCAPITHQTILASLHHVTNCRDFNRICNHLPAL